MILPIEANGSFCNVLIESELISPNLYRGFQIEGFRKCKAACFWWGSWRRANGGGCFKCSRSLAQSFPQNVLYH